MTAAGRAGRVLAASALAALLAGAGCAGPRGGAGAARPRSVVLISIDTCRADRLGAYGDPGGLTPSLDAIAREGVVFLSAQSTNPITLPAHSSLLTGTLPPVHGVRNNESYRLDPGNVTLAEVLRERGFRTAAFVGAFPLAARFGLDQGFEVYDDRFGGSAGRGLFHERPAEEVTRGAVDWLAGRGDEPFFLFLHYFDPHAPYAPPAPYAALHAGDPYAGEVAYADHWIGRLVGELKRLGLYDDTLLVVTADHGESLGEHGEESHSYFVYQSTLRVPLIVRAPGVDGGRRVAEPVGLIDVMPTVLGALGIEAPARVQGADLTRTLRGEPPPAAGRALYSESFLPTSFGCSPLRALVQGRWKYIWSARPELYDLARDPAEADDRVEAEPDVARSLHDRLRELLAEAAPAAIRGEAAPDAEAVARLEALGYVGGGGAVRDGFDLPAGIGDPKDFVADYERILAVEKLLGAGRLDAARAAARELLERHPDLLRAHALLGRIEVAAGRPDEAMARFRDGLAVAGRLRASPLGAWYPDLDYHASVTHANLAALLRRRGDLPAARDELERALAAMPGNVGARVALGGLLEGLGELVPAREQFEQALRAAPDDAAAHYGLAVVLARIGELDAAERHYERAIELDPTRAEALNNLGILLVRRGEPAAARARFEQALRVRPDYAAARENLERLDSARGAASR